MIKFVILVEIVILSAILGDLSAAKESDALQQATSSIHVELLYPTSRQVEPGQGTFFSIRINNVGSNIYTPSAKATSATNWGSVQILRPEPIAPHQSGMMYLYARAHPGITAGEHSILLTVDGESIPLSLSVVDTPLRLPSWVPLALLLCIALAILLPHLLTEKGKDPPSKQAPLPPYRYV